MGRGGRFPVGAGSLSPFFFANYLPCLDLDNFRPTPYFALLCQGERGPVPIWGWFLSPPFFLQVACCGWTLKILGLKCFIHKPWPSMCHDLRSEKIILVHTGPLSAKKQTADIVIHDFLENAQAEILARGLDSKTNTP